MPWLELHIQTAAERVEATETALLDCNALSVTLRDHADQPILEPGVGETPLWQAVKVTGLFSLDGLTSNAEIEAQKDQLASALCASLQLPQNLISASLLDDKKWEREWLTHFKPLRCGEHLWVCPEWQAPPDKNAINLRIDPGLAFGTGSHETTLLCLQWLDAQPLKNKRVIDFGCGSGILGIAALLLGAELVVFVDNDPQALTATQANLDKNNLHGCYSLINSQKLSTKACHNVLLDATKNLPADLIIANILAKPLIALAPLFLTLLKTQGAIVLSGVLEQQADEVAAAYQPNVALDSIVQQNDWVRLTGIKVN
jgi:ribosomal protein L11 methyltransferase